MNHIDGNKANNHVDNLEWTTPKENTIHSHQVLKHMRNQNSEKNSMSKLTEEQVIEIIHRCSCGEKDKEIAKDYGVSRETITSIRLNKSWKHIPRS